MKTVRRELAKELVRRADAGTQKWVLDPYWEILLLASGDVVFNHVHAREFRLRAPTAQQLLFLRELDQSAHRPSDELFGSLMVTASDLPDVQALVRRLATEGVVHPASRLPAQGSLPVAEINRFRSFLAWLGQFTSEPYGAEAFQRLRRARVAVIGAGGAGSFAASMLTACGVGHLVIVDGDTVAPSNLVRQLFYLEGHIATSAFKAEALCDHLRQFSSFTTVDCHSRFLRSVAEFEDVIHGCDLVLLTADQPRILINRTVNMACVQAGVPLLYSFVEQIGPLFVPGRSPCFACLEAQWRDEMADEHDEIVEALQIRATVEYPSMVSGPIRVADAMVNEALGLLAGLYPPRTLNRMIRLDNTQHGEIAIALRPDCPACGGRRRWRV